MKLSLVIPCYNEEKGIPNLAAQLNPVLRELEKKYTVELVFVDDGSTDNTYSLQIGRAHV
jgi:glycosyltransferase involved in cell wall biosynthesis